MPLHVPQQTMNAANKGASTGAKLPATRSMPKWVVNACGLCIMIHIYIIQNKLYIYIYRVNPTTMWAQSHRLHQHPVPKAQQVPRDRCLRHRKVALWIPSTRSSNSRRAAKRIRMPHRNQLRQPMVLVSCCFKYTFLFLLYVFICKHQGAAAKVHKCELCGSLMPKYRCAQCNNQLLCASCDEMYHRHPKRKTHSREVTFIYWIKIIPNVR